MPALPEDIGPAMRAHQVETWSAPAIKARYPNAADGAAQPADGFFDSAADAQTAIAARGSLIGTERRRFTVVAQDLLWLDPSAGVPSATLVDAGQGVNGAFLVSRMEVDLNTETATLEVFG